jgi:lipopolysaccharide transport system ATP-binding protein
MSAIIVTELSKRYVISHERTYDTLRDTVSHGVKGIWETLRRRSSAATQKEDFWALSDVSFRIEPGQVVGVIGRNGAGKSTLLKILSRITEPTTGRIELNGRVASLLEVGTGFHPELTGRENVFLNGAILGMTRLEIRRKFDEIVAFAEVERFLDTPVKRYSSGMYVRLAFAVAAHLEPEILIVDEVLAVGDSAFQKKCLGKMKTVSQQQGRTVLFVSHSLPSIRQLCSSAVLLSSGRVQAQGPCAQVLETYQHGLAGAAATAIPSPPADLLDRAYITAVTIESLAGQQLLSVPIGVPWRVRIMVQVSQLQRNFVIAIGLKGADGMSVQTAWLPPRDFPVGEHEAIFTQDRVVLEVGTYTLLVGLTENGQGYYAATSGVGTILNSMHCEVRRV